MNTNAAATKKAGRVVIQSAATMKKAAKAKKTGVAQAIANAAIAAAHDAANVWLVMSNAVEQALSGCTIAEADKFMGEAKAIAKKEAGEDAKLNSTAQQYLANAFNVWRAGRIVADPAKMKTADAKAAAAALKEARASGSGKRVIDAARDVLKAVGIVKPRAPKTPDATTGAPKAEEAPAAKPVRDIIPEARDYLRTLRADLFGVTLSKAGNDALRGLALLLKLDAPIAE